VAQQIARPPAVFELTFFGGEGFGRLSKKRSSSELRAVPKIRAIAKLANDAPAYLLRHL
jgi:hypothetical protein